MTTTEDTTARPEGSGERTDGPVHLWFELTYANFLVWHRAYLQSMPLEWQQRFVELAEELDAAYRDQPHTDFEVATVRLEEVGNLSDAEMRFLDIDFSDDETEDDDHEEYYLKDGTAVSPHHRVGIPVPDPVPHYNRGRTYVPPDEEAIAALRAFRADRDLWPRPGGGRACPAVRAAPVMSRLTA
jgi:hypothetical protein